MNRSEILDQAKEYITVDRAATHGGAEDSFMTIARFWADYLDTNITREDVCVMMVLLKVARIKGNAQHADSWVDIAGYSALGGEIATGE